MNEEKIRQIVQQELEKILGSSKYTFERHIQILNGRNIQVGKGTGTKIGTESTQKIGFYGATPVVRAGAITAPTVVGAAQDSDARTAIGSIITALKNIGITA